MRQYAIGFAQICFYLYCLVTSPAYATDDANKSGGKPPAATFSLDKAIFFNDTFNFGPLTLSLENKKSDQKLQFRLALSWAGTSQWINQLTKNGAESGYITTFRKDFANFNSKAVNTYHYLASHLQLSDNSGLATPLTPAHDCSPGVDANGQNNAKVVYLRDNRSKAIER